VTNDASLSHRQIIVAGFPARLAGLDEEFEALYQAGQVCAEDLGPELVARARRHNYIPTSAEHDFATALLREYDAFCRQKESGQATKCRPQTWRGIPREQVPWFPMLDERSCDGCDKCLEFCSSGVYAKQEDGLVRVVQPLNCVVGCDACARLCAHKAITFPPRNILQTLTR
jgi:NAD-dependent dihydropyrimidine dehydrogenase PreA subunit